MTTLAKIRNRAGLLVTVIAIAMASFVLGDLATTGNTFFSPQDNIVGEIGGAEIKFNEFDYKVRKELDNALQNQINNGGAASLDENTRDMIVQQTWNQLMRELIMNKEYEAVGVGVSTDELYDLMLGEEPHAYVQQYFTDRNAGGILRDFATPDGKLDMTKVLQYNQQMNPQQEADWVNLEKYIREARLISKYNNLIKKGLYVTQQEAQNDYQNKNRFFNVKYVTKRYSTIADSAVTVTESDLQDYYNDHLYEYKQDEEVRKIEYVVFDAMATDEDRKALENEVAELIEEFGRQETSQDDSLFVLSESDARTFDGKYLTRDALSPMIDTLFTAEPGMVFGPYMESNSFKISKLVDRKESADSARVRHILIGLQPQGKEVVRSNEEAKAIADSLVDVIKSGAKSFDALVNEVTDDPGSADNGGDYGWFNAQSSFVEPFKNAGLDGKKGDLVVVETTFGYHIIEVLDVASTKEEKVKIATVERHIVPSPNTMQTIYQEASVFAGENNTIEKFEKAIEEQGLNKRIADNIKEGDKSIPGLDNPKQMIRWAYDNDQGTISTVFEFDKRYVVASLAEVTEAGTKPFEQVRDIVEIKAKEEKKADMIIAEFEQAVAGVSSIDDFAGKVSLETASMQRLNFASGTLSGVGKEDEVIGKIVAMEAGALSQPIQGKTGVFVVTVESISDAPEIEDYKDQIQQIETGLQSKVDYQVYEALKKKAQVVDHKAKFY